MRFSCTLHSVYFPHAHFKILHIPFICLLYALFSPVHVDFTTADRRRFIGTHSFIPPRLHTHIPRSTRRLNPSRRLLRRLHAGDWARACFCNACSVAALTFSHSPPPTATQLQVHSLARSLTHRHRRPQSRSHFTHCHSLTVVALSSPPSSSSSSSSPSPSLSPSCAVVVRCRSFVRLLFVRSMSWGRRTDAGRTKRMRALTSRYVGLGLMNRGVFLSCLRGNEACVRACER